MARFQFLLMFLLSGMVLPSWALAQDSVFYVEGINRRWDFGEVVDGAYRYSFIILTDKVGQYYDFGSASTTTPSQLFNCSQLN